MAPSPSIACFISSSFLLLCLLASCFTLDFIIFSKAPTSLYAWKSTPVLCSTAATLGETSPGEEPRSSGLAASGLYGEKLSSSCEDVQLTSLSLSSSSISIGDSAGFL